MKSKILNEIRDDEGSSLVSTLLLLVFLVFLITTSASVINNQVLQYKQTAYSYESKTMIEMTEKLILDSENGHFPRRVVFSNGKTTVIKVSEESYTIKAELSNQYTSKKTVVVPLKAEINELEELDEGEVSLDNNEQAIKD